ncbi:MAG: ATP synthase F1 subunit gamma [Clostridia bacterium]|nr:ATP synthase F1 subunit gamma [Clostridia bacterium]
MSASNMKAIKNRMKSIKSTRQITKAMELVSTSKMNKAMERIEQSKPYFEILSQTLDDIARDNRDFSSVFTRPREGRTCHIVIAGDRGLAGGYNHNLFKSLDIQSGDIIFPIGKKVIEHFPNERLYTDEYERAGDIGLTHCHEIGRIIASAYEKGEFTRVTLSYTSYKNMLVQEPKTVNILPIHIEHTTEGLRNTRYSLTIYEPDAETVFERIVPGYIAGMIYGAVSESVASELSARRNAMESATNNADEMLNKLELEYNSARQASITQELTEIIAGAENL